MRDLWYCMLIQVSPPFPVFLPVSYPIPPHTLRYLVVHLLGSARLNAPGIKHVRLIAFEAVRARLITTWATHASTSKKVEEAMC